MISRDQNSAEASREERRPGPEPCGDPVSLNSLIIPPVSTPEGLGVRGGQASRVLESERCSPGARSASQDVNPQATTQLQSAEHSPSAPDTVLGRGLATLKALGTSVGAMLCFSMTGVFNQAARGGATDVAHYPNPFLYATLRSAVASFANYCQDREALQANGFKKSWQAIGPEGRAMCVLMGINNVLWVPAFLLTDLASAIVIACFQPFVHAVYDRVRTGKQNSPTELLSLGLSAAALGSIVLNTAKASTEYPHAWLGNLAAGSAMLCFSAYMIINHQVVERERNRAGADPQAQEAAKRAAEERLKTVPFFSQVTSALMGVGLFVPFHSGAFFSGGLGVNAANTIAMAAMHGIFTAAGLSLRTVATQRNKPLVVSLISNVQVGLTPALGYLLLGSAIPDFAIVGGALSFAASMVTVAGEYLRQGRRQEKEEKS